MNELKRVGLAAGGLALGLMIVSGLEAGDRTAAKPRDVLLTGRIVDLQNFMTGKVASSDYVKCTEECLRAGVPAAIETEDGLIIIGEGVKGPGRTVARYAMAEVELRGRLYERHGLRYVDLTSIEERREEEDPWSNLEEPDDEPEDRE